MKISKQLTAALVATLLSLSLGASSALATAKEDFDQPPAPRSAPKVEAQPAPKVASQPATKVEAQPAPKVAAKPTPKVTAPAPSKASQAAPQTVKAAKPFKLPPLPRHEGVDIASGKRVASKVREEEGKSFQWAKPKTSLSTPAPSKTLDKKALRQLQRAAEKIRKAEEKARREEEKRARKEAKEAEKRNRRAKKDRGSSSQAYYNGTALPHNYEDISIFGAPVATKAQAVAYIKACNKKPSLACSVEDIVKYYWEEAGREGVRPDLALCQALVETGVFSYGGDVKHKQNNFCGLGTTGGGVRGASFKTPQLGVRAHIQHLLAYARKAKPKSKIIDPRYDMAHNLRLEKGLIDKWSGLNGTWAMGSNYCEKIMVRYVALLQASGADKRDEDEQRDRRDSHEEGQESIRERIERLLREKD